MYTVKKGWQNLYIGKKIKKGAAEHEYCLNKMAERVYRKKRLKKGAVEHVHCLKDGKTGWQNLYIG